MAAKKTPKMIWPSLHYADAHRAIDFLVKALGFKVTEISESPDGIVQHAELRFPEGGGVMIGTALVTGNEFQRLPPGVNSVYVVTDDPDGMFGRATAAGAIVIRALKDEDYGSRGFTITDPEGNFWSFGTYRGA